MNSRTSPGQSGDKKQQIISAAARVFAEKGFHQAKMEEIAQAAAVGKGTVYEYFSSKQDLFAQMFQEGCRGYQEDMERVLEPDLPVGEKLAVVVFLHLDFIRKHQDIGMVMQQACIQLGDELKGIYQITRQKQITLLTGIFQSGIDQGLFRQMNCSLLASLFMGAYLELTQPGQFLQAGTTLPQLAAEIVDVFLRGVAI